MFTLKPREYETFLLVNLPVVPRSKHHFKTHLLKPLVPLATYTGLQELGGPGAAELVVHQTVYLSDCLSHSLFAGLLGVARVLRYTLDMGVSQLHSCETGAMSQVKLPLIHWLVGSL